MKYTRMIGVLGINDDARNAPMLPEGALPAYRGGEEVRGRAFTERAESMENDARVLLLLPAHEGS